MSKVVIVADYNHEAINSHFSSGFVQFDDGSEIHFLSLNSEAKHFCAHTKQNGKITFPNERIWAIHYG